MNNKKLSLLIALVFAAFGAGCAATTLLTICGWNYVSSGGFGVMVGFAGVAIFYTTSKLYEGD
jgi:hypothetical protein